MKNKIKQLLPVVALACSFVSVVAQAQTSISINQGSVVVRSHHSHEK